MKIEYGAIPVPIVLLPGTEIRDTRLEVTPVYNSLGEQVYQAVTIRYNIHVPDRKVPA